MKRLLFITAFLIVVSKVYCQSKSLTTKLTDADSVFLISHQSIPHSLISIVDSLGKEVNLPLFVKGKLNYKSVQEKKFLNANEINDLAKMLAYYKNRIIEHAMCFDPHHAIIIIKAGKLSYIDLCFGCGTFKTSKDIQLTGIEKKTWKELYDLFKRKGIKYKMHGD